MSLPSVIEEICTAVRKIKVVSWVAIHRERFPLTPLGIYGELCRNAQVLLERQAADAYRRLARLAAADIAQAEEPTQEEFEAPHPDLKPLYYRETNGPDLEAFKMKCNYRPQAMPRAVAQSSEVLIDSMRSLLELHYDEVHTTEWMRTHATKRAPARESEYKIFHKVAQLQRQRPNQQLCLPASMKSILRQPSDELQWARLEML